MAEENNRSHNNSFSSSEKIKNKRVKVNKNISNECNTANSVLVRWLDSPEHKEAIEAALVRAGIGVVKNENGINYFTQLFTK